MAGPPLRRYAAGHLLLFAGALGHALLTWPLRAVLPLFAGGTLLALVAEATVIRFGLLSHRLHPKLAGVPAPVLLAWPAVVYVSLRIGLLVAPAWWAAAAVAAVLGTAGDAVADPIAVREGVWAYPRSRLSRPRFRGVPWWNFLGWVGLVFAVAMLPAMV
jgi:hypothetical protein